MFEEQKTVISSPSSAASSSSGYSEEHSTMVEEHQQQLQQYQEFYAHHVMPNDENMKQDPNLQQNTFYNYGVPIGYPPYGMYFWPPGPANPHDPYYSAAAAQAMPNYPGQLPTMAGPYNDLDMMKRRNERAKVCRAPYTSKQLQILKERFEKSDRIELKERHELAKIVNLTPHQIKVWFQNRRFKMRRDAEKERAKMEKSPESGTTKNQDLTAQSFAYTPEYFTSPDYAAYVNQSN